MKNFNKAGIVIIFAIFVSVTGFSQTLLDIQLGTNNIPITEVQFEYNGNIVTQAAGVTATNTAAVDRVNVNYMEIDDAGTKTILYPNNFGSVVTNNNFTAAVGGVGVYSDGTLTSANDASLWEPAMEEVVNSIDLLEFLYYDAASNLPGGDDFDILFVKGIRSDDYVVIGERDGNTYFTVTPLGVDGNPITTARKLRFGFQDGPSSGNGSTKYDWDIGLCPTNYSTQSMNFTVVDAGLFETGGSSIFGFRIDNNGEADVKFFGLSENSYADNPNNPLIGGIVGNVYNDADGLVDNTVDGTGINTPSSTQLYATLYSSATNITIASVAVESDGTYEFLNLDASSTYAVRISSNQGVPGNSAPGLALPAGWVNTGEKQGTGTGDDGNPNGIISAITVTDKLVTNINFGIDDSPDASSHLSPISDPTLGSFLTVGTGAAPNLSGTDTEDGTYGTGDEFEITSLPAGADELWYNGSKITFGENGTSAPSISNPFKITNYDPSLLRFKFMNPNATDIQFNYRTIDAAGVTSNATVYRHTFSAVLVGSLSGIIYNDADGLEDNTVDGTTIDSPESTPLYASLYDVSDNEVIATMAVTGAGTYLFEDLIPNADYAVVLSTINGAIGATPPAANLPTDWLNTGEKLGTGIGSDGTANGIQTGLTVGTSLLPNVNFGIEKRPTADDYTYTIPDPILNSYMEIGLGAKSGLTGNDFEDGAFNEGEKFGITSLPTNGNELYYNGTQITLGDDGINPPSPSNPFTIPVYDPALLEMKFTGNGSTSTSFDYVTIDAAGNIPTTPATYTMNYSAVVSGSLSGTVYNDADGLMNNTVDGIGIDDPETTPLYATLYNASTDEVIASIVIDINGNYLFENLSPNPNYGVLISTNQGVVGATLPTISLPTDWVNTGEFRGTGAGDDGTIDGTQTGITVGTILVPHVNFGIEKRPEADAYAHTLGTIKLDSVWNVGSASTDDLSGSDFEDGSFSSTDKMGITSLPTNGNEMYYNDVLIEFGEDGINPPSYSNPFVIANYDPSLLDIKFTGGGSTSSEFEYVVFDAADEKSEAATYTLNYPSIEVGSLEGNVFNDANGLENGTVDGLGINNPEATQLYAILYDNDQSIVLDTFAVENDGTYFFDYLPTYADYGVLISRNNGSIGAALPVAELPAEWVYTGDKLGTGMGSDGTANGDQFGLAVTGALLPDVNFGINKRPEADNHSFGISNPAAGSYLTIGSGSTSELSGDDFEDGVFGANDKFGITSLPTSGNELYYNSVQITLGQDGTNAPSLSNPFVIDNYDPNLLEIKFTGAAQTSTQFEYITIDAAGTFPSSSATYELTYSALPVEWAAFNVEKMGESGRIYFATASENKASHFFVQKSLDGKNFRNIAMIKAQGTATSLSEYEYIDRVLNLGTNYYRIAQVDVDGTIDFTSVKNIVFNANHTTLVYPNPAPIATSVNIKYYSGEEAVQIVVSDMLGHEIIKTAISNPAGWNETTVDVAHLSAGVYALRVGTRQQAVIFTITE